MKRIIACCLLLAFASSVYGQDLIPFRDGQGKWGFKNKQGAVIVPGRYEVWPEPFQEGMAIVKNSGLAGAGVVDHTGREVVAPQYTVIYNYTNGVAAVCTGGTTIWGGKGKWGFIDQTGKVVVPLIYDQVRGNFEGDSYVLAFTGNIATQRNLTIQLIDKTGKIITYPGIDEVTGNFYRNKYSPARKGDKWGLIDQAGKTVIPFEYEAVWMEGQGFVCVKKNEKWGYVDLQNQWQIVPQFEKPGFFRDGYAIQRTLDGEGCIDKTGKVIIPFEYSYVIPALDVSAPLVKLTKTISGKSKSGLADPRTGKILTPLQFDRIGDFKQGIAQIQENGKYGYVHESGKVIVPPEWDYSQSGFIDGLAAVKRNNKYGFIDKTGKVIVQPIYDYGVEFNEGLAVVELNKQKGYIDTTGKVVIPLKYKIADRFNGGAAMVIDHANRRSFVDRNGVEIK